MFAFHSVAAAAAAHSSFSAGDLFRDLFIAVLGAFVWDLLRKPVLGAVSSVGKAVVSVGKTAATNRTVRVVMLLLVVVIAGVILAVLILRALGFHLLL